VDHPARVTTLFAPSHMNVWGVRENGQAVKLHCHDEQRCVLPPVSNPKSIGAYCAVNTNDTLRCVWHHVGLDGIDEIAHHFGGVGSTTLLQNDGRLRTWWFDGDGQPASLDVTIEDVGSVVEIMGSSNPGLDEPDFACVRREIGTIECHEMLGTMTQFTNPPYVMMDSDLGIACAVRDDWRIECNTGETYDFGPIRDIAVTWYGSGIESEWFDGTTSVCVITETNAIRCAGARYDFPDLQAALPTGDP
jgi:hypothetical protein